MKFDLVHIVVNIGQIHNSEPKGTRMAESVAVKLEKSRQSLLDLSTRNRLLSLPTRATGKILNIHDELTSEIYKRLVIEGKHMTFLPGRIVEQDPNEVAPDDESGVSLPQPDEEVDEGGLASRHKDTKLQTKLASDKLQHRLLEMYFDARTFIEEQGVNILYLGLGQLKWFDRNAPDKERSAPLILLPVALERKSAAERFQLIWLQDDASENLSLAAKLKADFGLLLPEFKAGDDFDPVLYLDEVAKSITSQESWSVQPNAMVLGFFSFAKFLMYRDLDPETWPSDKRIDQQPLILATLQEGFPAKDAIFPDGVHVDKIIPVAEQRHVVDADSSQSLAIEAVRKGENLVIQGPPGTGKSQTITNVIAAAVADGKKVLFVSEKMAALEVVYRRLNAIGLGPACIELHSNRTNKRRVLDELKAARDLGRPKIERREELIQELGKTRDELNRHVAILHARVKPTGITPFNVIGHLVRLQNTRLTGLPTLLEKPESWSYEDFRQRKTLLNDYQQKAQKVGAAVTHPWRGCGHTALLKLDADHLLEKIPAVQKHLDDLLAASAVLSQVLGFASAQTTAEIEEHIQTSKLIGSAPSLDRVAVANAIWNNGIRELEQLIETGTKFQSSYGRLQSLFVESAWKEDLDSARRQIAANGDSLFRFLMGGYRKALATVKSHSKDALPKSKQERLELVDSLMESQQLRKSLAEKQDLGRSAFGSLWDGETSDWAKLENVLRWMKGQDGNGLSEGFRTLYSSLPEPAKCAQQGVVVARQLILFQQLFGSLIADYKIDLTEAFGVDTANSVALLELQPRLVSWLDEQERLFDWMQYQAIRNEARELGLRELIAQTEKHTIPLEQLIACFERGYYERLLKGLSQNLPEIATFDGDQHTNKVERFRALDKQRIELARAETALKHFDQIPRALGGIGPMGILNGEIARKRGHMPLRKLFKLTGEAIQSIKPVFMMSPLSVAQFLEPGCIEFDILVIDEASQIEPIDALGAVARCKQIVVVGDDRQLPPTRFFSRMTTEVETSEDDDESFVAGAGDVESILSLCMARGMPQMMLRWHYRSRHQSLIAVSNQQFYKSELFIVPSPYTAAAGMGLKFNYVQNGVFDTGGTRVNREEAKVIASKIIEHAKNNPHQSLGVAAFSLQQKIAIQDELELLRRQHLEVEPYFNDHPNEPFFIKNLENVQGDERDVIFISVAYARNSSGYLPMKFGPVSMDGGERRLNVLISRAKLRCEVFSSIKAEDIDLDRGKGKGVAALKVFLGYAETGRLSLASRETREMDSPFEEEVKRALEAAGVTVHPQIGIAGFFIDLAVLDQENSGRYLLGIECDGASYHSSRSARDRDRLRQSVLEDHGWILHRVWSTDWFRQPAKEIKKILNALEAAKAELTARQERDIQKDAGKVQVNIVDRENHSIIELTTLQNEANKYQEADFAVPKQMELHEVPLTQLAKIVQRVVEIEGPIRGDEVVTRIRSLWGLQRAGNRIRDVLDEARKISLSDGAIIASGEFLDIPDRSVRVRDRSDISSANLRKPEYLPPQELQQAIKQVLIENLGGKKDEIPSAVAKKLGFTVVSAQLRELILDNLTQLHGSAQVTITSGDVFRVSTNS